jgi:hypothetical protein
MSLRRWSGVPFRSAPSDGGHLAHGVHVGLQVRCKWRVVLATEIVSWLDG